jgi:hypothetical protein
MGVWARVAAGVGDGRHWMHACVVWGQTRCRHRQLVVWTRGAWALERWRASTTGLASAITALPPRLPFAPATFVSSSPCRCIPEAPVQLSAPMLDSLFPDAFLSQGCDHEVSNGGMVVCGGQEVAGDGEADAEEQGGCSFLVVATSVDLRPSATPEACRPRMACSSRRPPSSLVATVASSSRRPPLPPEQHRRREEEANEEEEQLEEEEEVVEEEEEEWGGIPAWLVCGGYIITQVGPAREGRDARDREAGDGDEGRDGEAGGIWSEVISIGLVEAQGLAHALRALGPSCPPSSPILLIYPPPTPLPIHNASRLKMDQSQWSAIRKIDQSSSKPAGVGHSCHHWCDSSDCGAALV